jgi:hypothetical protein
MTFIVTDNGASAGYLTDDRSARQLIIALAAIVVVWSIACGLTFAAARLIAHERAWLGGPAVTVSHTDR